MQISDRGLQLIAKYEGCRLMAYQDPVGIWTIGYGHTKGVYAGQVISQALAEQFLREDVAKAEQAVEKYDEIYHWTQNQYDALVSFAYNVGSIDQLTQKGSRTIAQISAKIPEYNKGKGQVLPGLVRRRAEEQVLFNDQSPDMEPEETEVNMKTIRRGSRGKAVKLWQIIIDANPDGIFGADTERLTRIFQAGHGLESDGVVGHMSWTAGLGSV
ncbi:MAG: glycoside hydrolase family protein [Butyrivibrio sp.]|nr:glycoside hydrolase family protein [Muribaculum sp.]MCM1551237.1 glycoside hydrolase family protein [Butyrivibrio sp.]